MVNEIMAERPGRGDTGLRALARQVAAIVRLGAPVSLSRVGMLLLIVVDVAMVGRHSSVELAHYGLANAVQLVLLLLGVGMLIGVAVLTAQAVGARAERECGVIWRAGVLHALALGAFFALLSLAGRWFYGATGQDPALAQGAAEVLLVMALGLPGALLFVCSTLFLEALKRPLPGLVAMALANLLNAGLNALLIPPLGAEGAAWATTVARSLAGLGLALYILRLPDAGRFNIRGPMAGWRTTGAKLRRLGWPLGLAQGLESCAFSALSLFAGLLGATAVAGFQIAMMTVAFLFMAAIGVGAATAVHVGQAVGRGDRAGAARAGWSGLLTILCFTGAAAAAVSLWPHAVGGFFTDDPAVLALVGPTLVAAAFMLIPDGAQGVLMSALRGAGDVWVPTAMHLCSFTLVMTPAAYLLALELGYGAPGLMIGALCGVGLASLLLAGRFAAISRRELRRL